MRSLLGLGVIVPISWGCVGCAVFGANGLLSHHVAEHRREVAREHWNGVRGNVELQIAEQHFKAGRLKEAEISLRKVLATSPKNLGAYKLATQLYIEQGQLARAREAIAAAARLPDHDAQTEYLAGIVAQRYGKKTDALQHYMAAQSLAPDEVAYVLAATETLVALGKPNKALQLIKGRLTDFDGCAAAWLLAARICRMIGQKRPAAEYCREAGRLVDDDPWSQVEVGLILIWAGQEEEGIGILQPLVDSALDAAPTAEKGLDGSGPVTPNVIHALARAYMAGKNWSAARKVLRPLMSADGTDATAWCLYARAALMAGDVSAAAEALSTLNRRILPTPETLLLQAYVAFRLGDDAATRATARKALELDRHLVPATWLVTQSGRKSQKVKKSKRRHVASTLLGGGEMIKTSNSHNTSAQALLDALAAEKTLDAFRPIRVQQHSDALNPASTANTQGRAEP